MSILAGDQFACASLVMRDYTNYIKLGIIYEHVIPCSMLKHRDPKKDSQNLSYVLVLTMGFLGVSHDGEAHG